MVTSSQEAPRGQRSKVRARGCAHPVPETQCHLRAVQMARLTQGVIQKGQRRFILATQALWPGWGPPSDRASFCGPGQGTKPRWTLPFRSYICQHLWLPQPCSPKALLGFHILSGSHIPSGSLPFDWLPRPPLQTGSSRRHRWAPGQQGPALP